MLLSLIRAQCASTSSWEFFLAFRSCVVAPLFGASFRASTERISERKDFTRCERTTERRRDRRSTGKTSLKRDSKGVYGLDDVLDRSLDLCRESEEVDGMQRR